MPPARIRVAIVNESADPARGGAETSVREMADALAACGAQVTLVHAAPAPATTPATGAIMSGASALSDGGAPQGPGAPAGESGEAGVREFAIVVGGGRVTRTREFLRAAGTLAAGGGFDIVHAVTPLPGAQVYQPRGGTVAETIRRSDALAGRGVGGWLRRAARRFNARQQLLLREERRMLGGMGATWVAPVSEYGARQVRDEYPSASGRVCVVFNAIRVEAVPVIGDAEQRASARECLGLPQDARICAFCAHNFRLKGLRELLAAVAALPALERPMIAIIGRGDVGAFRRQSAQLGIETRVKFCGTAPAATWTAAADMLAHPTWYDPCSRVVLEAVAAGLPVVTTAYNGAAELLPRAAAAAGGPTGFVVDEPSNIEALAAALRSAGDPVVALAARRATTEMRAICSMERHARELMVVYERARR